MWRYDDLMKEDGRLLHFCEELLMYGNIIINSKNIVECTVRKARKSGNCAFFLGGCGGYVIHLFSMVSFFACTCPNRSGVGAIDNPDWFEQVFHQ